MFSLEPGRLEPRAESLSKVSGSSQGRDNIRVFPTCRPPRPRRLPPNVSACPERVVRPFAFDTHTRLLRRGGEGIPLPPRVLGVLELLLRRAGDVVARQELIDRVWKDAFVTDTSLAEAVSVLRQTLGDDPQSPTYIQTLHRRGYRFVAPVSTAGPARKQRASPDRRAGRRARRLAIDWRATGAVEHGRHLRAHRRGRGLASDAKRQGASAPAAQFAVAPAAGTAIGPVRAGARLLGRRNQLAWSGCDASGCRLYVRALDRLEPRRLPAPTKATRPSSRPMAGGSRTSPTDGSRKWRSRAERR